MSMRSGCFPGASAGCVRQRGARLCGYRCFRVREGTEDVPLGRLATRECAEGWDTRRAASARIGCGRQRYCRDRAQRKPTRGSSEECEELRAEHRLPSATSSTGPGRLNHELPRTDQFQGGS